MLQAREKIPVIMKAKKKKQVTPDEALDLLLAENDRKKAKREVGQGTLLAIQDKREETPAGALVAKKATIAKPPAMKLSKKTKKSAAGASGSQRRKKYLA